MGTSPIADLFNDKWCPLYRNSICIPGLDTYKSNCPYIKGWRSCWYYMTRDRCDKSKCGLNYDMYEVEDNE